MFFVILCSFCLIQVKSPSKDLDSAFREIEKSRQEHATQLSKGNFSNGVSFRLEEYHGSRLAHAYETKVRHQYFVSRWLGRDNLESNDDTIYVLGPEYAFAVSIASRAADGTEKYNLVGISRADADLDPNTTFFQGITDVYDGCMHYPWRYESYDLEDLRAVYSDISVQELKNGDLQFFFQNPINTEEIIYNRMFVDRKLTLEFSKRNNWQLSKANADRENYDSNGKMTERFSLSRLYFTKVQEFGHGIFENDVFIKGADNYRNVSHPIEFGRRLNWKPTEISTAEFTPEFYGIDPEVGVARAGINWWLWGTIIGCISMIIVGMWLKRRSN